MIFISPGQNQSSKLDFARFMETTKSCKTTLTISSGKPKKPVVLSPDSLHQTQLSVKSCHFLKAKATFRASPCPSRRTV